MKRQSGILIILVIILFLVSGCALGNKQAGSASSDGNNKGPSGTPDLAGEITSVSGSDVTLKVVEMPEFTQNRSGGGNSQNNYRQGGGRQSGNYRNETGADQGNQDDRQQQNGNRLQGRNLKYTGETKIINIPASLAITTSIRAQNGRESKTVNITDLKQGDLLQVWYSDKEKQTISRVSIMALPGR